MMKRVLLTALTLALALCGFAGCKKESTEPAAMGAELLYSYESYEELIPITANKLMFGSIEINEDKKYVTDGEKSARFTFDMNYGQGSLYSQDAEFVTTPQWKIRKLDLPQKFTYADKTEYLTLDAFNTSGTDLWLYLAAMAEPHGEYLYCDGVKLAAGGVTHARFDMRPWFFESGKQIAAMQFSLRGLDKTPDKKAVVYFDNVRIKLSESVAVPESAPRDTETEREILRFDKVVDSMLVLPLLEAYGDSYNSGENVPAICADYDPYAVMGERQGALKVTWDKNMLKKSGFNQYPYFQRLSVHGSLLPRLVGAKTVSVTCFNPSNERQRVALGVQYTNGSDADGNPVIVTEQKAEFIPAGETVVITFEAESGTLDKALDKLYIDISSWHTADATDMYFADLVYTK